MMGNTLKIDEVQNVLGASKKKKGKKGRKRAKLSIDERRYATDNATDENNNTNLPAIRQVSQETVPHNDQSQNDIDQLY